MMLNKLKKGSEGVAALEFVMVMSVIFGLIALTAPLGFLIQERVRLERVAGHTARFATAAPDRPRFGAASRRPSPDEVRAEAVRAYEEIGAGTLDPSNIQLSRDPRSTPPGEQISVTITQEVPLGSLGILLAPLGIDYQGAIMTVEATARQE